jgi:hypothetical protein
VCQLSLVVVSRDCSSLRCLGFSLQWLLLLQSMDSGCRLQELWCVGSVVLVHGFGCPEACGILVPRPGIEPTSLALEGRFPTTGPPGQSLPLNLDSAPVKVPLLPLHEPTCPTAPFARSSHPAVVPRGGPLSIEHSCPPLHGPACSVVISGFAAICLSVCQ